MQAEFINVFLEKQRDHLMDFVSRVIMAETKQHFADKEIEALHLEVQTERETKEQYDKTNKDLLAKLAEVESNQKEAQATIDKLKINIDDLNREINRLNGTINAKEQDILAKQKEISQLISDNNSIAHLVEEGLAIKSQMNTVTMELESAKKREQNMIADYQKLSTDYEELKTKYKEAATQKLQPTPVLHKTKK